MSELLEEEKLESLPESHIQPRSKISIVWLIPIIAIAIGSWLAFKTWSEMGPEITIMFKTAEGIEAGKTKIKFKNVVIGEVKTIEMDYETKGVIVTAEMIRSIESSLTEKTKFWVVTARINASGASGLDTLLSGAYIGIDPSEDGNITNSFTGLEDIPVITGDIPGKRFLLYAENLDSIEKDAPIYYRKFNVGRVEEAKLNEDGRSVSIRIFIKKPYDQWVNTSTRFWNASGIDISLNANGLNIYTESLVSILMGGIAFDSEESNNENNQVDDNTEFKLYATQADSKKTNSNINTKIEMQYVINFTDSVRGLIIGAPVEFRGIQMGEVTDIQLSFNTDSHQLSIPVTVSMNYAKILFKGSNVSDKALLDKVLLDKVLLDNRKERVEFLIKKGLRAQLLTGNLLTGQLYVSLDFHPDDPPFIMNWSLEYPEFPSTPGTLGELKKDISSILKKVDDMMTQANELSYKLNHNIEPELSRTLQQVTMTLQQTDSTLKTMQNTFKEDSVLQQDLQITLREFTKAARSMKNLTDYLEKHPESLLKGKKGN